MQITDPLPWGFTVQNPLPPIDSQDGLFHDGNPVTGELGTILTSTWLNNVQGAIHSNQTELVSVLSAAGIAPDAARPDQLLAALQALYLGKAAQAADSAKLEGHPASYFAKADDLAKAGSDPLPWPRTSPSRTHIQAGYAPLDGQELSRALYPDAWSAIQSGAVPVVTESEWQADPLKRGAWTYGNGSTTFRMPDWNGKSAGSKGAVFVRGDGVLSAGTPGLIQQDAFQGHEHRPAPSTADSAGGYSDQRARGANVNVLPEAFGKGITSMLGMGDARYGTETRPLNVTGVWVCRLFGAVVNPGAADASQLATDVARLWAQKVDLVSFTGSNQLLAANGYQRLPSGVIMQWGMTGQVGPTANVPITFPITFPSACASVSCIRSSANAQQRGDFAGSITPSGFVINNGSADNSTTYRWTAIGY